MRRRSSTGGEPAKARRRKAATRKRRNAPKVTRSRPSSVGGKDKKIALLRRERDEALEQQTAISDILRVISHSPSDVQPVLDSVAEHAAHICEAHVVEIAIVDNEVFRLAASFGEAKRLSSGESVPLDRSTVTGRAICDLQPVRRPAERWRRVPAGAGTGDHARTPYHPLPLIRQRSRGRSPHIDQGQGKVLEPRSDINGRALAGHGA
jgi:hypothetical protein